MGLLNIPIPEAVVKVGDSEGFAVVGLSPHDIVSVYLRHRKELSEFFDMYSAKVKELGPDIAAELISSRAVSDLISTLPNISAEIVAISAGFPISDEKFEEAVTKLKRFPLATQMEALTKIAGLTFSSDMPAGKFLAVVKSAIMTATAAKALNQ